MRFTATIVLAAVGLVAAQTTTTTGSTASTTAACAAQNIVDACLGSTTPILQACTPNDWKCMCESQHAVVTCYNNCPGDPLRVAADQQLTVWCQAASAESSRSVLASGTPTSTIKASTATTTGSTTATGTGSIASATSAAAKTTSSKGAASNVYAPGGLLAVAMGIAGML